MQVAAELFSKRGYADTSFIAIAKAAGVATRTVYQHYGTKTDIFFEVLRRRAAKNIFEYAPLSDDVSLLEALMKIALYIQEVSLAPDTVETVRLCLAESQRFPEFMREYHADTMRKFRARLIEQFSELNRRGLTNEPDVEGSAVMLLDLVVGRTALFCYAGWGEGTPAEAQLAKKVALYMRGRFGVAPSAE